MTTFQKFHLPTGFSSFLILLWPLSSYCYLDFLLALCYSLRTALFSVSRSGSSNQSSALPAFAAIAIASWFSASIRLASRALTPIILLSNFSTASSYFFIVYSHPWTTFSILTHSWAANWHDRLALLETVLCSVKTYSLYAFLFASSSSYLTLNALAAIVSCANRL